MSKRQLLVKNVTFAMQNANKTKKQLASSKGADLHVKQQQLKQFIKGTKPADKENGKDEGGYGEKQAA